METLLIVGLFLVAVAGGAWHLRRRRLRAERSQRELAEAVEQRRTLPPTLHPVIDPEICIGSLACLRACPEGDILGIIDGKAKLIHADRCIGHGQCAIECPVGAITLVIGTAERGVDLPEVDEHFQSSRAGVHVVGELGGMGLIKNAVAQGKQVAARLSEVLAAHDEAAGAGAANGIADVAIVGAGPAGIATAAELRARGRSVRVLDQQSTGGTIAQYPRQKLVLTEPLSLPYSSGYLQKKIVSKEELLEAFTAVVKRGNIAVEEGVRVTGLTGSDGAFELFTDKGPIQARKVVLATGRRGTPRKLGVPGEQLGKVTYKLDDAEQYDGCAVLVVGGGDSAVEAAAQLAEQSTAKVTVSYRGASFTRCRAVNQRRIQELIDKGRVDCRFDTVVARIDETEVTLSRGDGRGTQRLPNDFVLVLAGGELPLAFLEAMGVSLRRYHGERPTGLPQQRGRGGLAKERALREARRTEQLFYVTAGALILAYLSWVGRGYYTLSAVQRLRSPLHAALKSAGSWGHGVGIVATLVMMGNFLYPLRKRHPRLRGVGSIARWLDFHVFVGFMSPLVIAFHAAFQSKNHLATATAASLLIVMITGVIGRFLYGLVPSEKGSLLERSEVLSRLSLEKDRLLALLHERHDPAPLERLVSWATAPLGASTLPAFLLHLPVEAVQVRLRLLRVRALFPDGAHYDDFREELRKVSLLRTQARFFGGLKRLLGGWRVFHASLAVFLVLAIALHIGVSLYFGYGLGAFK